MKHLSFIFLAFSVVSFIQCEARKDKPVSAEILTDEAQQDSIFSQLLQIIQPAELSTNDSIAFLILPLDASCPSCRDKTIDSIAKYSSLMPRNHFVILSSNDGIKSMNGYFKERKKSLPLNETFLVLDSNNLAGNFGLYEANPTIYYTSKGKAYKKIATMPETVKQDLHDFFSGDTQK